MGRITGSRVAAALGFSPWQSPDDLIREMVRQRHGVESEFKGNVATQYGNTHEPDAILSYEMETGYKTRSPKFYKKTYLGVPFGATPDLEVRESGLAEFKCPYRLREGKGEFESIDHLPHYYAQMQIQMFCTGKSWCDFYQWSPYATLCERVLYDPTWIDQNIETLQKFYNKYVQELDNLEHLEPKMKEITNFRSMQLVEEYLELKEAEDQLKGRKQDILQELSTAHGVCKIGDHKLQRVTRKGSVQYAKVVKEHCPSVDLESYRGAASSYWKLT